MPAKKKPARLAPSVPVGGPYGGQPNTFGVNVVRPEPEHTNISHSPKKAKKGGR